MIFVGVLLTNSHPVAQIEPGGELVLTKLSPPTYPPLARQARLVGDLEICVEIGRDGGIETTKGNHGASTHS
jgi:hypothetical protein